MEAIVLSATGVGFLLTLVNCWRWGSRVANRPEVLAGQLTTTSEHSEAKTTRATYDDGLSTGPVAIERFAQLMDDAR